MQPGEMTERVTFQSQTRASDGGGGADITWANIATDPTVWAKVQPVRGREAEEGGQQTATARYRVTIRNRSDLDSSMRLVWATRDNVVLNVREMPDPGPRAMFREIYAEQGVAV